MAKAYKPSGRRLLALICCHIPIPISISMASTVNQPGKTTNQNIMSTLLIFPPSLPSPRRGQHPASRDLLVSGLKQSCALLDVQTVKCWGGNTYGQTDPPCRRRCGIPVTLRSVFAQRSLLFFREHIVPKSVFPRRDRQCRRMGCP